MKSKICIILTLIILITFAFAIDNSGANAPDVYQGLYPIKYNETGEVVFTNVNDPEWYNYSEGKWANAVTLDEQGQMNPSVATIDNITGYYVWIPRYAYLIRTGYNSSDTGRIDIRFVTGSTNSDKDGNTYYTINDLDNKSEKWEVMNTVTYMGDRQMEYLVHPAFNFEEELTGIWVGKYQASLSERADVNRDGIVDDNDTELIRNNLDGNNLIYDINNDGYVGISDVGDAIFYKGNKSHVLVKEEYDQNISLNNAFNVIRNMTSESENYDKYNTYGLGEKVNTHLIKPTEYGAVAYLADSIYGVDNYYKVYGLGSGKEYVVGYLEGTTNLGMVNLLGDKYKNIYIKDEEGNIIDVKGTAYLETSDGTTAWHDKTITNIDETNGVMVKHEAYGVSSNDGQAMDVGFRVVITKGENVSNIVKQIYQKDDSYWWLMQNGDVWVMGDNNKGQLGIGNIGYKIVPIKVQNDRDGNKMLPIEKIVCIEDNIYYIAQSGEIYLNGAKTIDTIDIANDTIDKLESLKKEQLEKYNVLGEVYEIYGNGTSTVFEEIDGDIYVVGDNTSNKLGITGISNIEIPTKISVRDIKDVGIGSDFSVFLKDDGSIIGYGNDSKNGNGMTEISQIAVQNNKAYFMKNNGIVVDNQNATITTEAYKIVAGENHLVVLKKDGSTEVFGQNNSGLNNVVNVFAGKDMTVYITSDNKTHLMENDILTNLSLKNIVYAELNGMTPYFLNSDRQLLYKDGSAPMVAECELYKIRTVKGDIAVTEKNSIYNFKEDTNFVKCVEGLYSEIELKEDGTLVDYRIYGNSVQNGTPSLDDPVEIDSVGNKWVSYNFTEYDLDRKDTSGYLSSANKWGIDLGVLDAGNYIFSFDLVGESVPLYWYPYKVYSDGSGNRLGYITSNRIISNPLRFTADGTTRYVFIFAGGQGNTYSTARTEINKITNAKLERVDYVVPVEVSRQNFISKDWVSEKDIYRKQYGRLISKATNLTTSYIYGGKTIDSSIGTVIPAGTYTFSASSETFPNIYATIINNGVEEIWTNGETKSFENEVELFNIRCDNKNVKVRGNFYWKAEIQEGTRVVEPKTYNIYLNEPLKKVGDYVDYIDFRNQKVVRRVGELELDSTIEFSEVSYDADNDVTTFGIIIDDKIIGNETMLSNSFRYATNPILANKAGGFSGEDSSNKVLFKVSPDIGTTEEEIRSWLGNNVVKIQYPLIEPVEESINLEEIFVAREINGLKINTGIEPANLMIEYNYEGNILD